MNRIGDASQDRSKGGGTPSLPNTLTLLDTTLRDGELTHGVRFSPADRLAIASLLAASGVDVIEVAIASGSGDGALPCVPEIARHVRSATLCVLAPLSEAAIEDASSALSGAAAARIHLFQAGAPDEACAALTERLVRRAAILAGDVEFTPANGACASMEGVTLLVGAALRGGARTINLADTLGRALPEEVGRRVAELVVRFPELHRARVSFHGHDDLGLATANTLAAVRAGARQVEVAVNGLGARAGNAALEEVVAALGQHASSFGTTTRVDPDALVALSRLVEERSGLPVGSQKAIVGRHAHWRPGLGAH
jgi:2-isopropylmalate synthase